MKELLNRLIKLESDIEMIVDRVRDPARFRSAEDMVTKDSFHTYQCDMCERIGDLEGDVEACLDYFRDVHNGTRLDKRLKSIEERLDAMNSNLSVHNSAIRTVSDCLERAKVSLHGKINDLTTDTQIEAGNIYDAISDVIDQVTEVKFTTEVNKCLINRRCVISAEREIVENDIKRSMRNKYE